jgi:hypothetical protein
MRIQYFILTVAVAASLSLTACVSTRITSSGARQNAAPVERIVITLRSGNFQSSNTAASLGQRNLNNLTPNLSARLPVVFTLNGLPARMQDGRRDPTEKTLSIIPVSASYSTRSGQALEVRAELTDAAQRVLWQAEIRMATLGFGKFDDKVADDIAVQLLEKMRADKVVQLPAGAFRTQ